MAFDWKKTVATVAPTIGLALGGPLGALGVKALLDVFGLGEGASDEEIAKAIAGASPEQLLALKKADQEFALALERIGVDIEKIRADDRKSARDREIAVRDRMPGVLAVLTLLGFFGVLILMAANTLPDQVTKSEAFLIMLGILGAVAKDVYSYYFGSSSSSARKDDTIKRLSA